jgi:hypothetical protein
MVSLGALWLPIVLSAVLVFVTSSVIHMFLGYHNRDYTKLPNEDAVRAALRAGNPAPRQYIIPHASGSGELRSEEMKQKYVEGPVAVLNIKPAGPISMGVNLVQWFVFALVISFVAAYVASRTEAVGADHLHVSQIVGTVAWLGYAGGQIPNAIWMGKPWSVATKEVFDGLVYGLLTAVVFAWLWPRLPG